MAAAATADGEEHCSGLLHFLEMPLKPDRALLLIIYLCSSAAEDLTQPPSSPQLHDVACAAAHTGVPAHGEQPGC